LPPHHKHVAALPCEVFDTSLTNAGRSVPRLDVIQVTKPGFSVYVYFVL